MPGQFAQGGVTMRDCSTNRAGFDRVLMAVAATFLTVSATSALAAQSTTPRASAAELAIDAAVPRPEPANVPPPTIGDFKMDTTATVPDATKAIEKPAEPSPTTETEPRSSPRPAANDAATAAPPAATATAPAAEPAKEPVKVSTVAPADQPVADRLRDMIGAQSLRYFDRKNERAAVEKFYSARDYAPQWTQAGKLTDSGKGRDRPPEGRRRRRPQSGRLSDAGFSGRPSPDQLAEAELKLTASMLDYARQAQSGRMHWSQVAADILYPEHPTDPAEVLANISTAKDASAALDSYNPPHKLYKELLKAKLAELRGEGDGPMIQSPKVRRWRSRPPTKKQGEVAPEDPRVPQLRAKLGIHDNPTITLLRRQGRRRRAQIPGERRSEADRRARRPHGEGHQQPEARPADRPGARQHGTLALAAPPARRGLARQRLCHSQRPRLHAEGDAERRPGLDHAGRTGKPASTRRRC